jgi:transposase
MLETGDIERFANVGNYASYCRCVGSRKISNGKRKGSGNTKNGNKYLAWAFVEAANFAIRFNSKIKGFYQKKEIQDQRDCGHQSSSAQALPGLLLHYQRSGGV